MESIIYNKFLGQCLWTLCLKTMRGTGIGMVSMSPIMNPQSRGATVRIFFRIINFFLRAHTWIFSQWIFWQKSRGATSFRTNYSHDIEKIFNFSTITLQYLNFFGYLFYCHYFVYSNSTIIIKLTKPKTSYSLISKLSEVFEVTFFRISSKHYVGTGYIFLV